MRPLRSVSVISLASSTEEGLITHTYMFGACLLEEGWRMGVTLLLPAGWWEALEEDGLADLSS